MSFTKSNFFSVHPWLLSPHQYSLSAKQCSNCEGQCEVILNNLHQFDDKAVTQELVKVKGIGPWTAEMFLIFTLGREDIFSPCCKKQEVIFRPGILNLNFRRT